MEKEQWITINDDLDDTRNKLHVIKVAMEGELYDALSAKLDEKTHLEVSLCCSKFFTNQGIKALFEALNKMTKLEYLHLDLRFQTQISDHDLKDLSNTLKRNCESLCYLNLDCESCKKITNQGLKDLSESLSLLTKLKRLHLAFKFVEEITDQGIESISTAMEKLTRLEYLYLDFLYCPQISLKGLAIISKSVEVFSKGLLYLYLAFQSDDEVAYTQVRSLTNALSNMKELRQLQLIFSFSMTRQALRELHTVIYSKVPQLFYLNLNFFEHEIITLDNIEKYAKMWETHCNLI